MLTGETSDIDRRDTFESNGLLQVFLSPEIEVEENQTPFDLLFQRMKDQFQQTAFEKIRNSEKLSLYSQLKTKSGAERYLSDVTNIRHRTAMTRLRMSAHSLHIEEGRYTIPITSREDRTLWYGMVWYGGKRGRLL